jgi:hypothetical protein
MARRTLVRADDKPDAPSDAGATHAGPESPLPAPAASPSDAADTRTGAPGLGHPAPDDRTVVQTGVPAAGPPRGLTGVPDKTEVVPETDIFPPPAPEKAAPPPPAPPPGEAGPGGRPLPSVPGYRVLTRLGEGTYGEVWLAQDERTGIHVAVKFFAHGTTVMWQLIQAEVKQLARLHADPGIVQLLNVELASDPPYYVMAFADRGSLAQRLEKGPLPVAEALDIFRQVAEALAYVHAKGVRHCDLKPGNILLTSRGRALIGDFGQAHLSSEVAPALGTFFYMAPEQADLSAQIPDTRWDVYGLGAVFYALVTGRPPHEDPRLRQELAGADDLPHRLRRYRELVQQAPRPQGHRRVPGMDRRLAEIVDRCLEADPARRLRDAGAVLAALARRERQLRQRPLFVFGFVAQVLLFLVMAGIAAWAVEAAVDQSEKALTSQLLQSDQASASLVASALEENLTGRLHLLERQAARDDLRRALRVKDRATLDRLMTEASRQQGDKALSWMIVDDRGRRVALHLNVRLPADFAIPQRFAWRDWFNGIGDRPKEKDRDFPPIRHSHVSQPFLSKLRGERTIGLSTPVFAPGGKGKVLGVLYTPVPLKEIHAWLARARIRDGFAVLIDHRGYCLRHGDDEEILAGPDPNPPRWHCPTFDEALSREGSTREYEDPIDHRTYLAGYAPLKTLGWAALVQHDRQAALRPVAELKRQMLLLGLVMLVTVSLLLSALWGWLIWTLRRKDRVVQA